MLERQPAWQAAEAESRKNAAAFQTLLDQRRQFQDDLLPLMTGLEEFTLKDGQEAKLDFTPADAALLI